MTTTMPTVILAGAPAAGKTLVRTSLDAVFAERFPTFLSMSVDDLLRAMHRAGRLDGNAWLDENGALLLRDWESPARFALAEMVESRRQYPGPAILEVPVDDRWVTPFLKAADLARQSAVIYLHAPTDTRLRRNRARRANRVSDTNLLAMRSQFPDRTLAELAHVARCFLAVDTSVYQERTIQRFCDHGVASYLESLAPAPELTDR